MTASDAEVLRIAQLLERLIASQQVPIPHIEGELLMSPGPLARLLDASLPLQYSHILDVLEVLSISPASFFKVAYEIREIREPNAPSFESLKPFPAGDPAPFDEGTVVEALRALKVLPEASPGEKDRPED